MERDFRFNWSALVEEAVRRRRRLRLTQKQLASLAKVSTPTVSRFEQAEKDIQLSTVLSILDTLGMTDKRTLTFPDEKLHVDIDDAVIFWGREAEKRVRCRISREALDDHFSDNGRLKPDAAFKKYRGEIEGLARRKYLLNQLEPDGTVLVRTDEIA
jgi:transcriptional regulator with XRE-family HTH domain